MILSKTHRALLLLIAFVASGGGGVMAEDESAQRFRERLFGVTPTSNNFGKLDSACRSEQRVGVITTLSMTWSWFFTRG